MAERDEETRGLASPPCFLHELDPAAGGGPVDPQQRRDVMRWRKAERERLIAERLALPAETRRRHGEAILAHLLELIGDCRGLVVSAYWPFRGEPDLRPLFDAVWARGGRGALPLVVEKGQPLIFRTWRSGQTLARGVWNIPVPEAGEAVRPDVVVAPIVGFDRSGFRLGYGGGFFDRTLAALPRMPRALGVGYAQAELPTIFPQPHDIPMERVILETGPVAPRR